MCIPGPVNSRIEVGIPGPVNSRIEVGIPGPVNSRRVMEYHA